MSDETVIEVNPDEQDLDDVLLAMDVVDTLRHRERMVARELDAKGREKELIERLKEIYAAQGMDVPDRILKEGVQALAEDRFLYKPPQGGLSVRLAKLFVSRGRWLKPVFGVFALALAGWGTYQFGIAGPAQARAEQAEVLLTETLPGELDDELSRIQALSDDVDALELAKSYHATGTVAANQENEAKARASITDLQRLQRDLAVTYEVRVVYTGGRTSGIYTIPDADPNARNYYLVVEAIAPDGSVISVPIRSEETGDVAHTKEWAQRVSKDVYDRMADDKRDDQIIQNALIGRKPTGKLQPEYGVETPGGAILEW